ncbi:heme o synthase [Bacillus massiliglaciei]|uniref:heme o synthase n=1 Tax=Bacillus massiliglaciei TaxID=1816693 RepID=UPI000AB52711|nr:heme o synthase [Bacillus massiliglaciei]
MNNTEVMEKTSFSLKSYFSWNVIRGIIKTGIIKSNVMGMIAGLCLALYAFDLSFAAYIPVIVLAIIGTSMVVGGAGAINNFYDQDIDAIMKRTQSRPTVDGSINPKFALWLGIFLTAAGLVLLYSASMLAFLMGLLGFLFYVFPYTMWTKRTTVLNTEVGSLSGAMPPLIGWAAVSNDLFHPVAIGLFMLMFLWQPPHFYAIAIRRLEEYKAAGIPMLPVIKGIKRTKIQSIVYLILLMAASFLFWPFSKFLALTMLLLTIVWFAACVYSFNKKDDQKWAKLSFIISLNHLTILLVTMIIFSFIR